MARTRQHNRPSGQPSRLPARDGVRQDGNAAVAGRDSFQPARDASPRQGSLFAQARARRDLEEHLTLFEVDDLSPARQDTLAARAERRADRVSAVETQRARLDRARFFVHERKEDLRELVGCKRRPSRGERTETHRNRKLRMLKRMGSGGGARRFIPWC